MDSSQRKFSFFLYGLGMTDRLKSWVPFLISTVCYAVLLSIALIRIAAITQGRQYYLLDDTYIHLAIAKNLLLHGVYGISPKEPATASSSIVWPLLLVAVGKVFGLKLMLPLILNIISAFVLLAVAQLMLYSNGVTSGAWQTVTLVLIVLAFPLVTMTLDGMEHVLFGLAFILFLWAATHALAAAPFGSPWRVSPLLLSAFLLTSCRYEGVFAIFVTCLLLARRSIVHSITTALVGFLPILLFGLFSRGNGGMWVPNSLVMKTLDHSSIFHKLLIVPHQLSSRYVCEIGMTGLVLTLFCLAVFGWSRGLSNIRRNMLLIFLGTCLLHIQFARLQTATPRYESYFTGAGILVGSLGFYDLRRANQCSKRLLFSLRIMAAVALLPLILYRGIWWEIVCVNGATSIYRQQYQAAQFFSRYYRGQPIVANDVGAVSFFADVHCLDLWGLGSNEVAQRRANGTFTTVAVREMALRRNVDVGFLYSTAFTGTESLPKDWIEVATWTIPTAHGNTTWSSTISFYATSPNGVGKLLRNLQDYQGALPPNVTSSVLDPKPKN
jgi:hypothetical protein